MTSLSNSAHIPTPLVERYLITRPSLFNGWNYAFWKTRMRNFIQLVDIDEWRIIRDGPFVLTKEG